MSRVSSAAVAGALAPDPQSSEPLYRQLYDKLRRQILTGALSAGQQIPSTRILAADLCVSRNTVMNAIEQLIAEGYLEGAAGTGTFVAAVVPEPITPADAASPHPPARAPRWSAFGERVTVPRSPADAWEGQPAPFRPGIPPFDLFPFDLWGRLASRRWRRRPFELLNYGDPAGYLPLRRAVIDYMSVARGIRAAAEQVIIVSGAQQGLELTARLLLDPGDPVWIEEPGYHGMWTALRLQGADAIPVPVDEAGLDVQAAISRARRVKMAYVTPSHQFPRGVTMTLGRRLDLLHWAEQSDAWILEDDYDAEFRYAGRPIPALQGLDPHGRVIYLGTFTKVLFPALRLAYLVVPPDLVDRFTAAKAAIDRQSPRMDQAILADFIEGGHLARHIRRMRTIYLERAEALVHAADRELKGAVDVARPQAGMHTIGWLRGDVSDRAVSRLAGDAHVVAWPLSTCYRDTAAPPPGLILGFAAYTEAEIAEATRALAGVITRAASPARSDG
ncbi:MAG TPA: PLP-dependent aminotransferase family protein [Vicinamibacterales bacterium]|nr:PLP-dependent aminotransferase family protein [Vicinamibacterales bacterium]